MIEYRSWSYKLITKEQAEAKGDFYVFIYENQALKRWDTFMENRLLGSTYILMVGESQLDMLNSYYKPGFFFSVAEVDALPMGITVYSLFHYQEKELHQMERFALDLHDNIVGSEIIFDPSDGIPDFPQTQKRYYDSSINPDDYLFESFYNEDGSLNRIEYNSFHTDPCGQDGEDFVDNPESLKAFMVLADISQELLDYYVSPYVLPSSQPKSD